MMKKILLSFGLIASVLVCAAINVDPIVSTDLSQERVVFIKGWHAAYEHCSLEQLSVSELGLFLEESIDVEEQMHQEQRENNKSYRMLIDGELVGYVSYDIDDTDVYIRQWALASDVCNIDTFRELIFVIVDYLDNVQSLRLDVRHVASHYKDMLLELGFEPCEVIRDHGDLYQGYQLVFGDKCGTCMCDFDDDDFESEVTFDLSFSEGCGCPSALEEAE